MHPTSLDWLNRHVWLDGAELETEMFQAREEGRDVTTIEAEYQRLCSIPRPQGQRFGGGRALVWPRDAQAFMDKVQTLPVRPDYPFVEPSDLAGIQAVRPCQHALKPWRGSRMKFQEKLHGGRLGRMAGCMLGKPVEG